MENLRKVKEIIKQLKAKGLDDGKINDFLSQKGFPTIEEVQIQEQKLQEEEVVESDGAIEEEQTEQEQTEQEQIEQEQDLIEEEQIEQEQADGEQTDDISAFRGIITEIASNRDKEMIDTFIPMKQINLIMVKVLEKEGYAVKEFETADGTIGMLIRKGSLSDIDKKEEEYLKIMREIL